MTGHAVDGGLYKVEGETTEGRGRVWCIPAALSAVSGISYTVTAREVARAHRRITGSKWMGWTRRGAGAAAAKALGIGLERMDAYYESGTLGRVVYRLPTGRYIIGIGGKRGHEVAVSVVEGKRYLFMDNHDREPVPFHARKHNPGANGDRRRVRMVRRVTTEGPPPCWGCGERRPLDVDDLCATCYRVANAGPERYAVGDYVTLTRRVDTAGRYGRSEVWTEGTQATVLGLPSTGDAMPGSVLIGIAFHVGMNATKLVVRKVLVSEDSVRPSTDADTAGRRKLTADPDKLARTASRLANTMDRAAGR